jgi:hypothetical protein
MSEVIVNALVVEDGKTHELGKTESNQSKLL